MQTYSYMIQHANGAGTGTGDRPTHCHQCKGALPINPPGHTGGTGYACKDAKPIDYRPQHAEELKPGFRYMRAEAICYPCCAINDRASMTETGRATLYVTGKIFGENAGRYEITNWCGTLRMVATSHKVSLRAGGFGADRMDVWFTGPDGKPWHGVQRGDNQLLRCRRLKGRKVTRAPTIHAALRAKLGREPTRRELCDDVRRILADGAREMAERGQLPHQRGRVK